MFIHALERHILWTRETAAGTSTAYWYDEYTWAAAALVLVWLTWLLARRYARARALRRRPRRADAGALRRVVKLKQELSRRYLRPGFSANIHAVGVGALGGGGYCIQVFLADAGDEPWSGAGNERLPDDYGGVPVVPVEMAPAGFLSCEWQTPGGSWEPYSRGIRGQQEVIVGGISGANTNLDGQSGTIGYFCTRRTKLPVRREVYMLSNSHVFADLRKARADEADLILQPSPGEPSEHRHIGSLVDYSALKFDGDVSEPNHVDAAIAKLWAQQQHQPVIPLIGAVRGYVEKQDIELGEPARKFGRTTGYTEGRVFSVYLDIWIRYDRTGQSAFFQNQILVEPTRPTFTRFVSKGDSGSLVVDARQHAVGLIFAGTTDAPKLTRPLPNVESVGESEQSNAGVQRVEGYGVANPISEVLNRLKIELLV